jgi:hypothetical protein
MQGDAGHPDLKKVGPAICARQPKQHGTTYQNGKNIQNDDNVPYGHKIDKLAIKISTSCFADFTKFTKIGSFGLKIYPLATLVRNALCALHPAST